ncbi:MAG: cellulase family glycosylhydrolase [Solirubrobacterales bacterium]
MAGVRSKLALALAAASLAAPVAAQSAPAEPLGHEGRWITDAQGRVVVLHGANVVAKGDPALPADRGFGADDAAFLAANGFNTVRLGVDFQSIEPAPGVYDDAFIASWVGQLGMLADHGIYTLLDVHQDQFGPKYVGNGLPDWMGIDNGLPNTQQKFPNGYFANPAMNRAFDNFWANAAGPDGTPLQDHYAEGLRRIAAAARDAPGLVGYDIFNEPWPGTEWPSCAQPAGCAPVAGFDARALTVFSKRAIAGIRAADGESLAFYEPNLIFDFGGRTSHGDVGDDDAGFSFHDYCLPGAVGAPPQLGDACNVEEDLVFDNADAQSQATGDALLLTEFGATEERPIFERLVRLADEHMVGWHVWTYANYFSGGQSRNQSLVYDTTKPPQGDNVDEEMLDALARPYPQLVAGTPLAYGYDPDVRRFNLRYSTKLADGGPAGEALETEVFVPELQYGADSWHARVSGAEIAAVDAQRLVLRNCAAEAEVRVVIQPGAGPPAERCPRQGSGGGGGGGSDAGAVPSGPGAEVGDAGSKRVLCMGELAAIVATVRTI